MGFQIDLNLTDSEYELLVPYLDPYDWANPEDGLYFVFDADSRLLLRLWSLGFQEGLDFWL